MLLATLILKMKLLHPKISTTRKKYLKDVALVENNDLKIRS